MLGCVRAASSFSVQPGLRVAIVGSGPSAFYTTKYLFKQAPVEVDMFERLPTPFGLVRFGVAPDHPEVKNVVNDFAEVAQMPGFRFFGNVEMGMDISLGDLRRHYDAVVVCTGAQGERKLGIPGEALDGVVGAPAFVQWYNGHPDFANLETRGPGAAAVVVGQGNVAVDVARILARSPDTLHATDIDPCALARIAEWQQQGLQTVHVVGRRGFIQAAFTNKELRELDSFDDVLTVVDPEELELSRNPASVEELAKSRIKKRSVGILEKMAANFSELKTTSKRVIQLHFLRSPAEILADKAGSAVGGIRLDRTELQGSPGKQAAVRASAEHSIDLPCGLVVRSVGFDLQPLPGLPLDDRGRVPHVQGRVEDPAGGLYVSGWLKRGPIGIIASNIADAQETVASVLKDLQQRDAGSDPAAVEAILTASGTQVVSFADWRRIEAEELRLGSLEGKAALKLTSVAEQLRIAAAAAPAA